jgi:hypothetical protein
MYKEMVLAKVTSRNGVEYFAVSEKTYEDMCDTSSAMTHIPGGNNYADKQFFVQKLGPVQVQQEREK